MTPVKLQSRFGKNLGLIALGVLSIGGCTVPEPDVPSYNLLADIMKKHEPHLIGNATADVSIEVCPMVSVDQLHELAHHPDLQRSIEFTDLPDGGPFEPPGTKQWKIRRGAGNGIVQSLVINLEPTSSFCRANIYNRSW